VSRLRRTEYRIRSLQRPSSRAVPDTSPEESQEVVEVALRCSTRSATACESVSDRRRRLADAAALDRVAPWDSQVVDATYTEPSIFPLLCRNPNTTMSGRWQTRTADLSRVKAAL
jgi:hypothetical protein